jgi:phage terminase small subunit
MSARVHRECSTPLRKPNAKRLWKPPTTKNHPGYKTKWSIAQKLDEFGCTPIQTAFCEEYIKDFNGTASCLRLVDRGILAKKSNGSAASSAWLFLSKLNVQDRIKQLLAERKKRFEVSQDAILRQLLILAYSDIRQAYDGNKLKNISDMDDETAFCIQEISMDNHGRKKIKFYDKNKDIELLAKHLGMFEENVNVNINPEKIQAVIDSTAGNAPEPIADHGNDTVSK